MMPPSNRTRFVLSKEETMPTSTDCKVSSSDNQSFSSAHVKRKYIGELHRITTNLLKEQIQSPKKNNTRPIQQLEASGEAAPPPKKESKTEQTPLCSIFEMFGILDTLCDYWDNHNSHHCHTKHEPKGHPQHLKVLASRTTPLIPQEISFEKRDDTTSGSTGTTTSHKRDNNSFLKTKVLNKLFPRKSSKDQKVVVGVEDFDSPTSFDRQNSLANSTITWPHGLPR